MFFSIGHKKNEKQFVQVLTALFVPDTGDVKKPTQPGAVMQWEVGCGNVNANHMPILQQLEATSSDSTMSKAVGHGIIGWHVTNNKPHTHQRIKVKLQIALL